MKKITSFLIAALIMISGLAYGQQSQIQPYSFTFTGKWNPSENPLLLDDMGLQDIQNLRKAGKHFKGVSGHTAVNSTALSSYPYILNGYHFKKDSPAESHVVVYAADAFTPTAGRLYQNTTAIPSSGNFSSTTLYTPTTFADMWRFSGAPNGNMVASNGKMNMIWGGSEIPATSFVTSSAAVTLYTTDQKDYSDKLNKNNTSNNIVISSGIDSYTKLLLHANGADASTTFTDSASGEKSQTAHDDVQIDTAQYKFGTGSALFDGTGDYISSPDHADWNFGTSAFTISFWLRHSDSGGTNHFGYVEQYVDANNYWSLYQDGNTIYFVVKVSSSFVAQYSATFNPTVSTWYHVELVRNGTSVYIFINGTALSLTATTAIASSSMPDLASTLNIGLDTVNSYYYQGHIDEFVVSNGIARHTANFTAPTLETSTASNYFLIGSKRPLQGVKFYISTGNTVTSTMTVKEWQDFEWVSQTVTDGTASGGVSMAATGSVTWTASGKASTRFIAGPGMSLYWYQFYLPAGEATLYYVTTDSPIQQIPNIWAGLTEKPSNVVYEKTADTLNYTADVGDESVVTYAKVDNFDAAYSLYIGFANPQQAIEFYMLAESENSDNSTALLSYWTGSAWEPVPQLRDGTIEDGHPLGQYGVMSFSHPSNEQMRTISGDLSLYYYRLKFSLQLDGNVKITEIRGIPYPELVTAYAFSETFQNRLFLFNEKSGDKNKALYSDANAPEIFNGTGSGTISFGDMTELTAGTVIYNVFQNTAVDQLLVTKANETWRLSGKEPEEWILQRMSANIGCVAPLSMVSAEVTESSAEIKRTVAIWQSDKGVVMSDGAIIVPISDDIKCYWDPNDSRYIPTAMQPKSVAWYDSQNQSYKLLIASGSTATDLNTELEYSLKYKEWTKIYRENAAGANPLQSGFRVYDTNGVSYTYGGGKDGIMYRLENGNTWNAVANISQYVHTKDIILDNERPLFRKSIVKHIRTLYKKKAAATGNLTITHYGDQTASVTGTSGQVAPSAISTVPTTLYNTQSVTLGPALYHSFKFAQTTSAADGLELLGFGVYYEPITTFRP